MKIAITGANGFIGAALAHHFAARGDEIVGFVRPDSELWRLNDVPIELHHGDIRKPETLVGVFAGADWVIHTAGKLGEAGVPEEVYYDVHVNGTRNVMQAVSAESPHARVLHISTPGVLLPAARQHPHDISRRNRAHRAVQSVRTHQSSRRMDGAAVCPRWARCRRCPARIRLWPQATCTYSVCLR